MVASHLYAFFADFSLDSCEIVSILLPCNVLIIAIVAIVAIVAIELSETCFISSKYAVESLQNLVQSLGRERVPVTIFGIR